MGASQSALGRFPQRQDSVMEKTLWCTVALPPQAQRKALSACSLMEHRVSLEMVSLRCFWMGHGPLFVGLMREQRLCSVKQRDLLAQLVEQKLLGARSSLEWEHCSARARKRACSSAHLSVEKTCIAHSLRHLSCIAHRVHEMFG